MSTESETLATAQEEETACAKKGFSPLQIVGWFSVGMAVATIGILVGAELRNRYKFNHRTPYDFYSNAGEAHASEFGVGV